jgi:hypothetical protein
MAFILGGRISMHGTFVDSVSRPSASPHSLPTPPILLPLTSEQVPEGAGRIVLPALLVPALGALMIPFWLVGTHVIADPAARAILAERPLLGIQLALGLLMLISIFGWPLGRLARRGLARRHVVVDGRLVRSETVWPFATISWTEPLANYSGVAHRVCSSLSGVRHELVLVHRRPSRSVAVLSAPQIPQETLDAAARLFSLAEIPSREAASFKSLRGYLRLAQPRPLPAAVSP